MAESQDLAGAVTLLRERLARLEAQMVAAEVNLAPLLEEKEALLQEVERLAAQRQSGAVSPELYESSLRALVERLALLDEEIAAAGRTRVPGRVDAVEADLADLARGLVQVEKGFRGLKEDLERVAGAGPVEGLRKAVDALSGELRENVRRLLQVDARAIEQLKEVQGILRGGRMDSLETEMERIRDLYRDFVSEDRIAQFTERVREVLQREEVEPLRKAMDRVEVAFERQAGEVQSGVLRLREESQARFDELRGQVEALREEALRVQRERLEALQKWVGDLAGMLGEQAKEIPALQEQFHSFQKRVAGLSSDLQALSVRVRYRPVRELEKEKVRLEADLDLLRGAVEKGTMAREEFEARAVPLQLGLVEIRERLQAQRQIEALTRFIPAQRQESKRILAELRQVPRPEQIQKLLTEMRRSMATQEMGELRAEMALARATLRNRIEELPVLLEERLREAPERHARALTKELRQEAERLAASLGQALRKEMEARLPAEVARHAGESRDALLVEMRNFRAQTERAMAGMSDDVGRLRIAMDALAEQSPALRRDVERVRERLDSLARRVERPGLETLLALKEQALLRVERLHVDGARGLLPPNKFEEEMTRAVAEAADIDARIDETLKMERVLARLQEHGQWVEGLARSVEEVRVLVAAGEARAPERERALLERVWEMLREQESVLASAAETRLRALHAEMDRQKEAMAALGGQLRESSEATSRMPDVEALLADSEARLRQALGRLAEQQEALRDALAAADLRRTHAEPAVEGRLRALEEGQRRLAEMNGEVFRLQQLVLAASPGPRRRSLDELQAERQKLIEFIQGLPGRPS